MIKILNRLPAKDQEVVFKTMSVIEDFKQILANLGLEYFNKYYSCYRGIVIDNQDPEYLGRLIVRVPQIHGKNVPSYWAFSKGMFSGKDVGFYALPNKGDWVWIQFEGGNPSYPIWEYGHWAKDETPAAAKTVNNRAAIYVFQTTDKSRMEFNNEEGYIRLFRKDGRVIELNDTNISLGSLTKSEYHALLGEITEQVLEELRTDIKTINSAIDTYCDTQIAAATSVPELSPLLPGYNALKVVINSMDAGLENLKTKITTIKSELVTLDK